jgi:hypothetical protein
MLAGLSTGRNCASAIVDKLFPFYFPYNLAIAILAFGFFLISGMKKNTGHKCASLSFHVIYGMVVLGYERGKMR